MGIGRAFGLGGSGGIFDRKVELVADLTSAFKTLNQELQKTRDLSAEISRNLKTARGGGGDLFDTSSRSTGTKDPIQNDGSQTGGNGGFNLQSALNFGAKVGGFAMTAMPTVQNAFASNLSASQAGFYSGQGLGYGEAQQRFLSRQGTFGSQEEVYATQRLMNRYAMQGSNSPVFQANVAAMSNLVPGSNSAAVGAVQALNQARNVNMLRMIGVNVRGANGMMREIPEIAKDFWNALLRSRGGKAFTKADLEFSMQPGNVLYSTMQQYFGNDPVLFDGIRNQLMMMAGGASAEAASSKPSTENQGLSTKASNSRAKLTAAQTNATIAFSADELKGYEQANTALININDKMAQIIKSTDAWGKMLQKIAQGKGLLDTLGASGNGATSGLMGLFGGGAANFLGSYFGAKGIKGGFSSLFNSGKNLLGKAGSILKTGGQSLGKWGPLAALLSGWSGYNDRGDNGGTFDWGSVGKSAGTAFVAGEVLGGAETLGLSGLVAALVAGGGNIAGQLLKGDRRGGDDTSTTANTILGMSRPLAGNPQITSPYGTVRYLTFKNGQKSPSYGKPHGGVDYGVPEGTPVYATKDGVLSSLYDEGGFGNYASINQEDGKTTYYGHLSRISIPTGQKVKAGDLIGYSGNSGNSTGPHLHFEVRDGANKIDPLEYLNGASDASGTSTANPLSGQLMISASKSGGFTLGRGGEGDVAASVNGTVNNKNLPNGTSINYGGVTVTMNFPAGNYNKQEIKQAIHEALSYDSIRKAAVSS